MKIGFDISMLVYRGSGVARYTYDLVTHALQANTDNDFHLFYSSFRRPDNFDYLKRLRGQGAVIHNYPFPTSVLKYFWNRHQIVPIEWFTGKMDYFFTSDFLRPPLNRGTHGITTVHDLTWKIYPEYHTPEIVAAHHRKMQRTLQGRDHILCDSLNTKADLLKYYPEAAIRNSINVIYPGVDHSFCPIRETQKNKTVLAKYGIAYPGKYLLYVGAIEPRKNVETCVRVFHRLLQMHAYRDYRFLMVGRAGWKNAAVFRLIRSLGLERNIQSVGYVADEDLVYIYNAAKVLLYLSHYEGFGLPPVEAARCGVPTLLYANSSLKELFKPAYPYTTAGTELDTLITLIHQPETASLVNNFDWSVSIRQLLDIISTYVR